MIGQQGIKVGSKKSFILFSILSGISLSGQAETTEQEWKFTLKNVYIE